MFSLLTRTLFLFVSNFFRCLLLSSLTLLLLYKFTHSLLNDKSFFELALILILFIPSNILYIYATSAQMQSPNLIPIKAIFIWKKVHADFLIFVCGGIFIFSIMALYFIDALSNLQETTRELVTEKDSLIKTGYSHLAATFTILIFGSRLLSLTLMFFVLTIWFYICRVGAKIPAYTDGYYMRNDEILDLTKNLVFTLASISLSITTLILAFAYYTSQISLPINVHYQIILIVVFSYFVFTQLHIGMWVATYESFPSRYHKSPLRL